MTVDVESKRLIGYPNLTSEKRPLSTFEQSLVKDVIQRHEIPETLITHPKGVIIPDDEFLTEKISDGKYVPYCDACVPIRRLTRISDGFECKNCKVKLNYDLTLFNGNIDVKYKDTNE